MSELIQLIHLIQHGNLSVLDNLLVKFNPLIYSWLRKNNKLHSIDEEDYYSMAKITLLECALKYDTSKNVPFESYYKIMLWHTSGNIIHKKQFQYVSLEEFDYQIESNCDIASEYEFKEELESIKQLAVNQLSPKERIILEKLIDGYTIGEIASILGVKKKTISNHKYILIKKIRQLRNT